MMEGDAQEELRRGGGRMGSGGMCGGRR